jgi:hypothetical protein
MATVKQKDLGDGRGGILDRLFFDHPRSVGMSWGGHGAGAVKVGFQLIGAGFAALIHAAVPGIFGHTASRTVIRIYDHIQRLNAVGDGKKMQG